MNGSHFDKQVQRERTCSLFHGTWRCVGVRIVGVGACALMVGQLLLPSVALATECADLDAAAGEVAAAPVTTAAPAEPATDAVSVAQATAEPQQGTPTDAASGSGDVVSAGQTSPATTLPRRQAMPSCPAA